MGKRDYQAWQGAKAGRFAFGVEPAAMEILGRTFRLGARQSPRTPDFFTSLTVG
jgi:hypothetical protein